MTTIKRFFYDLEFIESPGLLQVISIGMVSDDYREYYAISSEFNSSLANSWVRANVLPYIYKDKTVPKPVAIIADEIYHFINPQPDERIELWAWYGAYDHVGLCQMFGTMAELPKGMPQITFDIKQLQQLKKAFWPNALPPKPEKAHHALHDAIWVRDAYEQLVSYPFPES